MPDSPDSPEKPQINLVPARYVGEQPVRLRPGVRYYAADGTPRTSLDLRPGDTLLVPETELRGQTYLIDPSGVVGDARWLGVGDALLAHHAAAGLTRADLIGAPFLHEGRVRQYEFHDGRSDFQEIDAPWPPAPVASPDEAAPVAPANRKAAKSAPAAAPAVSDAVSPASDAPAADGQGA